MKNLNYTFKFGGVKFSADIGSSFFAAELTEEARALRGAQLPHYHAKFELFFIGNDPISLHTDKGTESYSNCVLCIPPFFPHYTDRSKDCSLLFSFETKETKLQEFSRFTESFFSSPSVFSFPLSNTYSTYLKRLAETVRLGNSLSTEAASSILGLLFYSIYTENSGRLPYDYSAKESYLITIERIINAYSLSQTQEVTLSTVASELHLGKKQTSRVIYKYFGKSLAELVTEKRLAAASNLLLTTDKSISEIAKEANFNSENYFFIQFKKSFGCTPLYFRKNKGLERKYAAVKE